MRISKTHVLTGVIIVEAILILILTKYRVVMTGAFKPAFENPLQIAVEYEASDRKFEELVKQNPEYISFRSAEGPFKYSLLANCAMLKETNYVRILISHGADVEQAVESLQKIEAVELLRQIQSEILQNNPKPRMD